MSELVQKSIGREEAIKLAETGWWHDLEPREVFRRQMETTELCMDFSAFHEATEKALGRSVWTHEFARPQGLWDEFNGTKVVTNPLENAIGTLHQIMEAK